MIKLHITFENTDKDAEDTMVSAKFKEFDQIFPWLKKIEVLNNDKTIKNTPGFIIPKGDKNVDSTA